MQASAQEGQSSISVEVGYTKSAVRVGNHALIIATDPVTGRQYATRAGPRLNDQGGCCLIQSVHGVYDDSFRDAPADVHTIQTLGTLNISLAEFANRAAEFSRITNSSNVPYLGVGSNSNSYAFTFAESLGFARPIPSVWAPGWNDGSPSPELPY